MFDLLGKSTATSTTMARTDKINDGNINTPRKAVDSVMFDDRIFDLVGGCTITNDSSKESLAVAVAVAVTPPIQHQHYTLVIQ